MNFLDLFPTIDLFVLFLFVAILILHLIFIKKDKLLVDLIAIYTAFALIIILPIFVPQIHDWINSHALFKVFSFAGLTIILFLALSHSNIAEFSKKISPTEFSTSFIYRVGLKGIFATTVIYFLPNYIKNYFGPLTNFIFNNFFALIFWFCLPLLFAFAFKFKTRRGWIE